MKKISFFTLLVVSFSFYAQKDSLNLGDSYADDQIYVSISYSQLNDQPSLISKSSFSYSLSGGFIKDFILNKQGNISFAAGIGYGYDFFNHKLKVEEQNGTTTFSSDNTINSNFYKSHNIEFPIEFRWRTSTANEYSFWRVYTGVKFLYNISNSFQFEDSNSNKFIYKNVSAYDNLQYGLTLSAGYDEFNINIFYGLSSIFKDAQINNENINTKILKFGLIFYFL
ncbi:PorT family protein [Polaribacter aestuariivivens]|uniref:PorT family protein n=1 Tax=Polaribacter aestuariivivens TaxID=2304626 RepID=A0A5S3N3X9_9FLAO|nr:porin family protein [Polaribacter aestuariivivens]TMM29960.1 PorT family protein [Polaribacter aestuariivivens]